MRQFAETGVVAVDLANTWDEYLDDPERLPDTEALHRFCRELDEGNTTTDAAGGAAGGTRGGSGIEMGEGGAVGGSGGAGRTRGEGGLAGGAAGGGGVVGPTRAEGGVGGGAAGGSGVAGGPLGEGGHDVDGRDMRVDGRDVRVAGEGDLEAVRVLRGRLRDVLGREPADRTRALAQWVAELPVRVAVEESGGVPRLRLAPPDGAGPADRLAVRAVAELLEIADSGDWERLRLCAARPCQDAFIDRSRPGRRQFCSTRCANRAHAAASRARHR
jgi:predicted RNA-binding Zn ribbon-like protein